MALMSKKILNEIENRGLKHKFVASRLGMHPDRFSDMVNGRRQIRVEEALILADLFGLEIEDVIETEQAVA